MDRKPGKITMRHMIHHKLQAVPVVFSFCMMIACLLFCAMPASAWNGKVPEADIHAKNAFQYLDAHQKKHTAILNPEAKARQIDINCISHNAAAFDYTGDPNYTFRRGVDVSEWTGSIDWKKVKKGGYDFAFIRLGYSGSRGNCYADKRGMTNLAAARKAGLDVGVYFFSLAINEKEARKEAEWVIRKLEGEALQLPVMYDAEFTLGKTQRNDNLSGEQFTKNAVTFCDTIIQAGREAGIYTNMIFECNLYDITQIEKYHIWFADYEPKPQSPYYFEFLQYNGNGGVVPGINTRRIDLNVQFIQTSAGARKEEEEKQLADAGTFLMEDGYVFDANYYAAKYPDVAAAAKTNRQLLEHYLNFGKAEGRFPNEEVEKAAVAEQSAGAQNTPPQDTTS